MEQLITRTTTCITGVFKPATNASLSRNIMLAKDPTFLKTLLNANSFVNDYADSEYKLARAFRFGRLVDISVGIDMMESFKWYFRAANHGNSKAMMEIGEILIENSSIPDTLSMARFWFEQSVAHGSTEALINLGILCLVHPNTKADESLAASCFREAGKKGMTAGTTNIGTVYAMGLGVPINMEKALKYWLVAAELGNKIASLNLMKMEANAKPVETDPLKRMRSKRGSFEASNEQELLLKATLSCQVPLSLGDYFLCAQTSMALIPKVAEQQFSRNSGIFSDPSYDKLFDSFEEIEQ